ncbi:MAG: AMP-binding protein [Lachnospiraceae bacterium]|nr:AMP-binding protein [Lachnospiraceae bacterium]
MIPFLKKFHDIALDNENAAIVDMEGRRVTSYSELDVTSGRIASYLLKLGIGLESVVVINCGRGMELIAARIGVMKVGAAFVCVEDMLGQERAEFIFKDRGASLIFDLSDFDKAIKMPALDFEKWADAKENDMAFIVYTSGSTGNPKGSVQEYGIYDLIMRGTLPMIEDYLPANLGNIIPESFVGGVYITVGVLSVGAVLHELPLALVRDQKGLLTYFDKHGINVTFMPPTLAKALIAAGVLKLSALHVGGEIVSDVYTDEFDVKNIYGPTEFGFPTCIFKLDRAYDNTPVGRVLEGIDWILIGDDGEVNEKEGILCVSLPYFRGYLNGDNDDCFFEKDGIKYFRTNDVASSHDGVITILGRDDDMIKLNANRIDPSEVERAVKKVTGAAFAVCKAHVRGGVKFLCVYVPDEAEIDREATLKALKNILPAFMLPSCFIGIKDLPENNNGKVDKNALPSPDVSDFCAVYAGPENDLQKKLCRLFEEILDIKDRRIGIDDSFFLLGGSSLHAMRLIMEAGIEELTFTIIYDNQTVRNIDHALKDHVLKEHTSPEINHVFPAEGLPLTDKQRDFLEVQLKYPQIPMFNYGTLLEFDTSADLYKLRDAVNKAFRAHPGLSVTIMKQGGEWRQFMSEPKDDVCRILELSDKELEKEMKSYLVAPRFDGSAMYRFELVKTPGRPVLLTDINHLICDGASLRTVLEDILSIYEGRKPDRDHYIKIIGDILKQEDYRRRYCMEHMSDAKPVDEHIRLLRPDLPGDKSVLKSVEMPIKVDRSRLLNAAKRYASSVSIIFMTATAMAFSKMNETDKVLLSFIFNGRNNIGGSGTVGMFIEYCPVVFDLSEHRSIETVISDVCVQVLKLIDGGITDNYPVIKDKKMTIFNYRGNLFGDTDSEIVMDADGIDNGEMPMIEPLQVMIDEDEGEWNLSIDYDAGVYLSSTIERFMDIFINELKRIIDHRFQ